MNSSLRTIRSGGVAVLVSAALWPATAGASETVTAVPAAVAALQREALASERSWQLVASLVTEVGPRLAGSPGDARAVAWAQRALEAAGFDRVWTEPVTVPVWVRGEAEASILAPHPQRLELTALGGSGATPPGGIEAEVVEVFDVPALEALPDAAVAGKIVFLSRPMQMIGDRPGYGEAVQIRSKGPSLAASKGAVATLIRSVAIGPDRFPHTGATRWAEEVAAAPAAALAVPDAELLHRQLVAGAPVRLRLRIEAELRGTATSANVLGEIRGRDLPDEVVLLAAHLDSWDIAPGAQDNGTGVATMIEAARLAARYSEGGPRRTVRVLLTANEEFGLSGARAWAEAHADEVGRITLATESDAGGGRARTFRVAFDAADASAAEELAALLQPLGVTPATGVATGGADLSPLAPRGVPLVDLGLDVTRYFEVHHTRNDTLERVVPADLRHATASWATVVWWGANRAERLRTRPPKAD